MWTDLLNQPASNAQKLIYFANQVYFWWTDKTSLLGCSLPIARSLSISPNKNAIEVSMAQSKFQTIQSAHKNTNRAYASGGVLYMELLFQVCSLLSIEPLKTQRLDGVCV